MKGLNKNWQVAIVLLVILFVIGGTILFEKVHSRIEGLEGQVMFLEAIVQDLQKKATLYAVGINAVPWAEVKVFTQEGENLLKEGEITPTCVRRVPEGKELKIVFYFENPRVITVIRTVFVRQGQLIASSDDSLSVAVAAWEE